MPRTDGPAHEPEIEAVLELVRRRGGRVTTPRRALVTALFEGAGHLTAEELVERVRETDPSAHLSTIYRNLEDLEELGVVSHTHLGHGAATYQLVSQAHAHFVCATCGATIDAPTALFDAIAELVRTEIGFEIEPSHFAVEGECASCAGTRHDRTPSAP